MSFYKELDLDKFTSIYELLINFSTYYNNCVFTVILCTGR